MNRFFQHFPTVVLLLLLAGAWPTVHAAAPAAPRNLPYPPISPSPVALFRVLLATNEAARAAILATKSENYRQIIQAKLKEYDAMPPVEREARLQASQLSWYLPRLMKLPAAERAAQLATVPAPDRQLIERRLGQWSVLPPSLQNDVLQNATVIRYFERVESGMGQVATLNALNPAQRAGLEEQHRRWQAMPEERRQQIVGNFRNYFEMSPADRNRTLARLAESDRSKMDKTFAQLGRLPVEEREQAMEGFKKFAELSPEERAAFLKTAEKWRGMSDQDRQLWRAIVQRVQAARKAPLPFPRRSAQAADGTGMAALR